MLDSLSSKITLIAALVTIIWGVLSTYLIIRKRQLAKPKLRLSIGMLDESAAGIPKKYRKRVPSIMALIPKAPTPHPLIVYLFVGLENQGKESLKNVRLVLEYKKQYLIDNELLKSVSQIEPAVIKSRYKPDTAVLLKSQFKTEEVEKALEQREVSVFGEIAQVSLEIPIIRQGEGVMFYDLLLLRGHGPDDFKGLGFGDAGFQNVLAILRDVKSLEDYFVVSILAFAENHEKLHSKLSVLRFSSGTKYEEALQKFIKAFWFNGTPRPGIYFADRFALWVLRKLKHVGRLSHKLYKDELGIMTFPEVALIRAQKKRAFAVVIPEDTQGQYFSMTPPNCDYFALPEHVNDFKTLMAWMGMPDKPLIPKKEKKSDVE